MGLLPEEVKVVGSYQRERKNIRFDNFNQKLLRLLPLVVGFTLF